MPWLTEDRRALRVKQGEPLLTEALKKHIAERYFPRYPNKRACLLPALHFVQHEYNWIPPQALQEIAEFLEIAPAEVIDTATFYEEYWLKPKGKYLVQVCHSLACEINGSGKLMEHVSRKYNIDLMETTPDKRFTLVELECLGACGNAPCALINDVMHEDLTPEKLDAELNRLPDDPHDYKDPGIDGQSSH